MVFAYIKKNRKIIMRYLKIKIALHLVSFVFLLSSCTIYKSIDVGDINDVRFKGMVDNKINLDLKVPINNPNNFKLKIKELDLDISLNGKYIGKMKNDTLIIIPKNYEGISTFPVEIQVENILSSAMLFYKLKKTKQVEILIEGKIIAKSFLHGKTIKVSEKQTIDLKEKLGKINL
jgi:LEA14-like dessication related protein